MNRFLSDSDNNADAAAAKFCQQVITMRDQLRQQSGLIYIPSAAATNAQFREAVARGASGGQPVGGFFSTLEG